MLALLYDYDHRPKKVSMNKQLLPSRRENSKLEAKHWPPKKEIEKEEENKERRDGERRNEASPE